MCSDIRVFIASVAAFVMLGGIFAIVGTFIGFVFVAAVRGQLHIG